MLEDFRGKRILVVVAHPDDELLGLGGTMNRLISDYNVLVKVVILGEGITSRSIERNKEKWEKELLIHKENIKSAQKIIGYQELSTYDFPDNRFDSLDLLDIIKVIEKELSVFDPDFIFTHHGGDVNIDHQKTFEAVITASRPTPQASVSGIFTFETPSGTEWRASSDPRHFIPNFFIQISEVNLNAKINAMESYKFEKRNYPHPRSPQALKVQAQRWGIAMGIDVAEAFCVVRLLSTR